MLSVGGQFINLDKIATLDNGRTLSGVVTDKVWQSVMPRTNKIELEDVTRPSRMRDMIHIVLLMIAKEVLLYSSPTLTLTPSFHQDINNELFAINNIRSSECGIPKVMTCEARQEFPLETFNNSNSVWTDKGWTNANTSNTAGLGNSIGQYANSDNVKSSSTSLGQLFHEKVILSICMLMSLSAGL